MKVQVDKVFSSVREELVKLGWEETSPRSGFIAEAGSVLSKGPMVCSISSSGIIYFFETPGRPGFNMWSWNRILREGIFMLPKGEPDIHLSPEEREVRNIVLKQIMVK